MEDFIKVTKSHNKNIIYLDYGDFITSECQKIRIIRGKYTEVEGKILKKNKRVVVEIKRIATVAMAYVKKKLVEKVN